MQTSSSPLTIGILALQGAYSAHAQALRRLGIASKWVRRQQDITHIDGLIIPGGESTALLELMRYEDLFDALKDYVATQPCLGTCAGLILLAQTVRPAQLCFGRLPVTVERNAYGRQRDSHIYRGHFDHANGASPIEMPLIRAPKIIEWDPAITIHAWLDHLPAFVQYGQTLACTFHPELSNQTFVHTLFVDVCRNNARQRREELETTRKVNQSTVLSAH